MVQIPSPVSSAHRAEAQRKKRGRQAEALLYWENFECLRHWPAEENARAAMRALNFLIKRHQPDQGGTHEAFLRPEDAYDQAAAAFRHAAV